MKRSHVTAIAVAAMLLLAGCSALPGSGGSQSASGDAQTVTSNQPDPYASASNLKASELAKDHVKTLKEKSFTVERSTTIGVKDGRKLHSHSKSEIDASDKQYLSSRQSSYGNKTKYTDASAGVTYQKITLKKGNETRTQYSSSASPVNPSNSLGKDFIKSFVGNVSYSVSKVETVNGEAVTRYVASSPDDYKAAEEQFNENQTVTDFKSSLVVSNDGYVKYIDAKIVVKDSATEKTSVVELTMSFTNIGSTDVKKPSWVSKAKKSS